MVMLKNLKFDVASTRNLLSFATLCSVALEQELKDVKTKLSDSYSRILVMEEEFAAARKSAEIENVRLASELDKLQERYSR
jgi:hypothetical protein